MQVSLRVFWLQKEGCSREEYEDAFCPADAGEWTGEVFRSAVCDGATETSFSGLWAKILADAYVAGGRPLAEMQAEWLANVSGRNLPWYAEQKLEAGAYAAVLGLTLCCTDVDGVLAWSAEAIGDCCLFQIRGEDLLLAFPLNDWQSFGSGPVLLCSREDGNKGVLEKRLTAEGQCQEGDVFYLMSDAISNWFLRRQAECGDAVRLMEKVDSQDKLECLCSEQRHLPDAEGRRHMPNDDVTFMRAAVTDASRRYELLARERPTALSHEKRTSVIRLPMP